MAYLNPDDRRVNKPPKIGGEGGINSETGMMSLGYSKGHPVEVDPYASMPARSLQAKVKPKPPHMGRK